MYPHMYIFFEFSVMSLFNLEASINF